MDGPSGTAWRADAAAMKKSASRITGKLFSLHVNNLTRLTLRVAASPSDASTMDGYPSHPHAERCSAASTTGLSSGAGTVDAAAV